MNIVAAISDITGRSLGAVKYAKKMVQTLQFFMVFANFFLIYAYLTNLYFDYEWLAYVYYALCAIILTGSGIGSTYFMSQAAKISTPELNVSIGSLMVNSLLSGVACGNLISHIFPYLKKYLLHNDRH